ncbi:MAG: glycosyltransferase family 2 protein [Oscillospiraceae bacterium]|nr:glycosyltransferase family 2 protein [Oscillospiraceae bacterium]
MEKRRIPAWAESNMVFNLLFKTFRMLGDEGLKQTLFAVRYVVKRRWQMRPIKKRMKMTPKRRVDEENTRFKNPVLISVIVPLFNTPLHFLEELIDSLKSQTYHNWQLCFADGSDEEHAHVGARCLEFATKDERVVYKKLTVNYGIAGNRSEGVALSSGDYVCFLDHDDLLAERALFEVVKAINETGADLLYSDEVVYTGRRRMIHGMHLKPDYSPDYLRCCNYICHLTVVKRSLIDKIGLYDSRYEGSEDYDFILRATENAEVICHIDEPIYYWRVHSDSVASGISAKPYAWDSARRAVQAHLERIGLAGEAVFSKSIPMLHVNYELTGTPLVSILIPTSDHRDELEKCINSVIEKSTYSPYEIIVVENNSKEQKTFDYYKELGKRDNISVVTWEREFNFSAICNFGASFAAGEQLLFLNNDIEIITPDWLEQMIMFTQRSDVGAAGIKLLYPDDTVQHGGIAVGVCGSAANLCPLFPRDYEGYMSRLSVVSNMSAVTGACMMVKKEAFGAVGGFDESLAVSFNDVDLCLKITNAGYYVVFNPTVEAYHYESRSRGYDTRGKNRERMEREKALLRAKWPRYFEEKGDPFYNKNFGKQSVSYDTMM